MARVLIVEDDDMLREMIQQTLELEGHEVLVACHGAEGVKRAQVDQPDIVLMDIGMPVLNGHDATRQIKADPRTTWIPVIALTAAANRHDRQQAIAAGADDYEAKPIDFERLAQKILVLVARRTV